jgi:hypothetical protein
MPYDRSLINKYSNDYISKDLGRRWCEYGGYNDCDRRFHGLYYPSYPAPYPISPYQMGYPGYYPGYPPGYYPYF